MTSALDVTPLRQPLTLPCGAVLANRIAKAAMSEQLGDRRHRPTPELVEVHRRWAAGGSGLNITGNVMVDRHALGEPRNVVLEEDTDLEPFRRWAGAASTPSSALWMQLNHPGRQSPRHLSLHPVAPSPIPVKAARGAFAVPRELTDGQIRGIIERFATAAGRARAAGFDGVQVHGAHGYLVSQFLSPRSNVRTDRWGGSPANRRRFLLEVVRAIRAEVGPAFPVGVKLNSADFQRGGFDEAESMDVVRALDAEGVDLLEVSGGTYERPAMVGHAGRQPVKASTAAREAYFLEYATKVRDLVSMPLMLTGGFRSANAMVQAVGDGVVDVVGLARPLAVEPDLPAAVLERGAAASDIAPLRPRLSWFTAVAEVVWYTQQIQRMGAGKDPAPGRKPDVAVTLAMLRNGFDTLRRVRG